MAKAKTSTDFNVTAFEILRRGQEQANKPRQRRTAAVDLGQPLKYSDGNGCTQRSERGEKGCGRKIKRWQRSPRDRYDPENPRICLSIYLDLAGFCWLAFRGTTARDTKTSLVGFLTRSFCLGLCFGFVMPPSYAVRCIVRLFSASATPPAERDGDSLEKELFRHHNKLL